MDRAWNDRWVSVTVDIPIETWEECCLMLSRVENMLPSEWVKDALMIDEDDRVEVRITEHARPEKIGYDVSPDPEPVNFGFGKE